MSGFLDVAGQVLAWVINGITAVITLILSQPILVVALIVSLIGAVFGFTKRLFNMR